MFFIYQTPEGKALISPVQLAGEAGELLSSFKTRKAAVLFCKRSLPNLLISAQWERFPPKTKVPIHRRKKMVRGKKKGGVKHHSAATKRRLSEANGGENNAMFGKKHTPEALQRLHDGYERSGYDTTKYRHTRESRVKMSQAQRKLGSRRLAINLKTGEKIRVTQKYLPEGFVFLDSFKTPVETT